MAVINGSQHLPCRSANESSVSALNSHQPCPTSHPTPVIRPCSSLDPTKEVLESGSSSMLAVEDYPQSVKDVKQVECIGGFDIPTSLSSVILLSSAEQAPHSSTSFNALETLFQ